MFRAPGEVLLGLSWECRGGCLCSLHSIQRFSGDLLRPSYISSQICPVLSPEHLLNGGKPFPNPFPSGKPSCPCSQCPKHHWKKECCKLKCKGNACIHFTHHGIIKTFGLEKTSKISSPLPSNAKSTLKHAPKCQIHSIMESLGWKRPLRS